VQKRGIVATVYTIVYNTSHCIDRETLDKTITLSNYRKIITKRVMQKKE
jgi:L-cysteine desulfidase